MLISEHDARALVQQPYDGVRWLGLGHEAASRTGERLVQAAAETGCWKHLPEHLSHLRQCLALSADG
jgi:hypothetical protein